MHIIIKEKGGIFDAWGFPPLKGDIHKEIIKEALTPLGFSKKSIDYISRVGRFQDLRFHIGPVDFGSPSTSHFERGKLISKENPKIHIDAFKNGRKYLMFAVKRIKEIVGKKKIDNQTLQSKKKILFYFGRALHTLQDFFSHSNYIDLNKEDKNLTSLALFSRNLEPPKTLKIAYTGVFFFFDEFPHGAFGFGENKDNPYWTRGGEKRFLEAKKYAVEHTIKFVRLLNIGKLYNLT